MHPIVLAKKRVVGWCFAYGKMGVQICIFSLGWALQSLDQPCKSFLTPILHILDLWALQSPGYKLYPLYLPPGTTLGTCIQWSSGHATWRWVKWYTLVDIVTHST